MWSLMLTFHGDQHEILFLLNKKEMGSVSQVSFRSCNYVYVPPLLLYISFCRVVHAYGWEK